MINVNVSVNNKFYTAQFHAVSVDQLQSVLSVNH